MPKGQDLLWQWLIGPHCTAPHVQASDSSAMRHRVIVSGIDPAWRSRPNHTILFSLSALSAFLAPWFSPPYRFPFLRALRLDRPPAVPPFHRPTTAHIFCDYPPRRFSKPPRSYQSFFVMRSFRISCGIIPSPDRMDVHYRRIWLENRLCAVSRILKLVDPWR